MWSGRSLTDEFLQRRLKGNWHLPFQWGEMIPFDIMQSLLQSETRNQGVVVTIRNMKRVKTTFGYLHEGG